MWQERLAKGSLFVLLFFTVFGTSMPFPERLPADVDNLTGANKFDQILWSTLYLLSFIAIIFKRHIIIDFLTKEKFLTLFLLWCLFSIFWSDQTFIAFKRWIQIFGTCIVILSALLYMKSSEEAIKYLKYILIVYIPLSFLSNLFIPGAIQPESGGLWRGLAVGKNAFAEIILISMIFWIYLFFTNERHKIVSALAIILCLIMVIKADSATVFITGLLIFCLYTCYRMINGLVVIGIDKVYSYILLFSFLLGILLILYLEPTIVDSFLALFGRDSTLTDRVFLWSFLLERIKDHIFFGCGFMSFWGADVKGLHVFYDNFSNTAIPTTGHSGYLDTLNEVGLIGLTIFILMIISFFKESAKFEKLPVWFWVFLPVLVTNLSSTSLFRPGSQLGTLFILAYLAVFVDSLRRSEERLTATQTRTEVLVRSGV